MKRILFILASILLVSCLFFRISYSQELGFEKLAEFITNTYLEGDQVTPDVSMNASSMQFIICWRENSDGSINFRIFNDVGDALTSTLDLQNVHDAYQGTDDWGEDCGPYVDNLSNEDFFVVWTDYSTGIYGRYIDAPAYNPAASDLPVFEIVDPNDKCYEPKIAMIPRHAAHYDDVAMIIWNWIGAGPHDDDNVYGRGLNVAWNTTPQVSDLTDTLHLDDSDVSQETNDYDGQLKINSAVGLHSGRFFPAWIYRGSWDGFEREVVSFDIYNEYIESNFTEPREAQY